MLLLPLVSQTRLTNIERAIVQTVAYSDIFGYPLRVEQIQRYLIGVRASLEEINFGLENGNLIPDYLTCLDGYFTLPGREDLIARRQYRAAHALLLWPKAVRYSKLIIHLPFVRMVAVTGALALDNEEGSDIDFLIVTEPRRLWLCRGLVMLLVRWGRLFGDQVCPNYFITVGALSFSARNLFSAHELLQMVPLYGQDLYWKIRRVNRWAEDYLPNASGKPRQDLLVPNLEKPPVLRDASEAILRTPLGGWVEKWEMKRKIRKLSAQPGKGLETDFCADWCKGHFGGYGQRTLIAYQERLQALNLAQQKSP